MGTHYLIIIAIIVVIVIIQVATFINTLQKTKEFSGIFPWRVDDYNLKREELTKRIDDADDEELEMMLFSAGLDVDDYYYTRVSADGEVIDCFRREKARKELREGLVYSSNGISIDHDSDTLETIVDSINDYLGNNKTVSDFHLMKDIVDRNCDAKEEEINTQIPIPLYMGLVGTMAGILVGILYLWLSGSISSLLSVGSDSGADGVEALLGGVALAMIASIIGIVLTTIGSTLFKTAKSVVEERKHTFLSWIQAKLLPTLSDNVVGAVRDMTTNLEKFNKEFSENTSHLGSALEKVNASYKMQVQLLDSVRKIADKDVSVQNLRLYDALKNSAEEIGTLGEYLHNTNEYLTNVRELNDKLDKNEDRTRLMEEMGQFFREELKQIEGRKATINRAVSEVDDHLQKTFEELRESTERQFVELQNTTTKQQDILQRKAEELDGIVSELRQLTAVKESISKLGKAMDSQNKKLDNLANAIHALAQSKVEGRSIALPQTKMPIWKKALIYSGIALTTLLCLSLLIANWDSILAFLKDIFRLA